MQNAFFYHIEDKLTRSIEGSISLMPLADLIQWIDTAKRSGTLVATNEEITRRFFFQDGTLIFLWSDQEGDLMCDELSRGTNLPIETIIEAMRRSEQLSISFLGYLSSEEGIPLEKLKKLMASIAENYLTTSFTWKTGHFRFIDFLPATVLSSPIILNPSQMLMESAVHFDETNRAAGISLDPIMDEIFDLIRKGAIEIPPIPADMQVLMNKINTPDLSIDKIIECISDPLLVSKILRICNSPFYGHRTKVGNLREAIVYIGLKSLISIVTVHALSGFSPHNADKVQQVLHHSMTVGMIAKQLARDMGANHEQAFICGLLHDLGRIIMLEMLSGYDIAPVKRDKLIYDFHSTLGSLAAKKWCFSEDIQESIRFHHEPAGALQHQKLVEIIHLSDLLAKNQLTAEDAASASFSQLDAEYIAAFTDHLDELYQEIDSIISEK